MSFKAFFLSLTIAAMLFFSAFGTTPVYADDGTTTETAETVVAPTDEAGNPVVTETPQPSEGDASVTEATSTEGSVSLEATPQPQDDGTSITDTPLPEVTVTATQTKEPKKGVSFTGGRQSLGDKNTQPILDQLPDDTTVTVIDNNGDVVPLGTQDSADVIAADLDPIWCPEGQVPTPGQNGCTDTFNSFDELLNYLQTNESDSAYQQAGTIYVQQGAYSGTETSIDLNNYNFNSLNNYNLTFQGGWDTTTNTVPTGASTQINNVPFTIGTSANPWSGSITFNNIWISDVTGQTALTVFTDGDISVSDVAISNSQLGADLNAGGNVTVQNSSFNNNESGGAVISAGGVVNVTNSQFNNNKTRRTNGGGLEVNGGSDVSLVQVTANQNGLFGANIIANGLVSVSNSVFSGNVAYTYNCRGSKATGGYGIQAVSTGNINFNGVVANDNYSFGGHLEGANVEVYNGVFNNNGDSSSLNNLAGKGLEIVSPGYVILDNVHLNNNKNFGLNIQAGDFVTVSNTQADQNNNYGANITSDKDVSINDSFFDGNKSYTYSCRGKTYNGYGLQVVATQGVFISNVSASGNNLFGASLDGNAVYIFGGFFNGNGSDAGNTGIGIEINSATNVTISDIEANNNQLFGANITSVDDVSISNGFFSGNKAYTYSCKGKTASNGYGLQIVTGGDITLDQITASDNYLFGAHLSGASLALATGYFNNNGSGLITNPVGKGLEIETTGNVSLVTVEANNNQLFGANIQAGGDVAITDGFFNGNKGYTYSCRNNTYSGYGLQVVAGKGVSLVNISANDNYLFGAHLEGQNIFVSYGSFSNNGTGNPSDKIGKGLEIVSTGNNTVSLYQVTANNNQLFGANIQSDGYVSVSDSIFSGNVNYTSGRCQGTTYDGYGLQVVTTNDVNLFNVTANDNGLYGASVTGNSVDVSNSTFQNNIASNGLTINATQVTIDSVTASNNGADGAKICANTVTVTNSIFENNGHYGLNVGSPAFTESGNTYTNNGSGGLFQNTSCNSTTSGTNNGNNHGGGGWGGWGWGWGG